MPPRSSTSALMYAQGYGVPQNFAEAIKWYRLAADQGRADAQSKAKACRRTMCMWLNLAASRYPASGKVARDDAVKVRDQIASKMTPAQIAEAQKLARVEAHA